MVDDSQLAKELLGKAAELLAANNPDGPSEADVRAAFFECVDDQDVLAILDRHEIPVASADPEDWQPVISEIINFAKQRIAKLAANHYTEWTGE